ncbi:MAG: agmatinase [Bacteroidota bacterium]
MDTRSTFKPGDTVVVGFPFDAHSSFMRGPAKGPTALVEAYHSPSANLFTEKGLDLSLVAGLHFIGNANLGDNYWQIERTIDQLLAQEVKVISLGGDHSITYPIMKAYAKRYPDLHILQTDAHGDLYPDFEGNPYSHACPFARIMEDGLCKGLLQVGVRSLSTIQKGMAQEYGVEIIEMKDWASWKGPLPLSLTNPLYLSLDLDVLDPAFAPGVSHHEPGGMHTRELITLIQELPMPLIGADIVELNPDRDLNGITAMVAAKLLREILHNMQAENVS